ncbi:addiction module protein [Fodinibius salsisoli]|jgi:putative addiction module component (TIGR02574 family)|uniref:Addiction module protein n=1 Tax=Fodinibius salsisoli TaxID=2820877 RepID=A0ABT3PP72_9BACT|nr:addiction module protein [Fodinibius salsisoli]MCW9707656.1 addiction module protein [Fodinibius salsisoli]
MEKTLINELSRLNKNEKLLLVEALWDSIASDPEEVEVPDHHKSILEQRLKTLEKDKKNGSSWKEIRQKYL